MCGADNFHCHYGHRMNGDDDPCIPNYWVNDGMADCEDGSDENKGLSCIICIWEHSYMTSDVFWEFLAYLPSSDTLLHKLI